MVVFVSLPSDHTALVSARPIASALARWQAAQRLPVTNRHHQPQSLPPLAVFLLAYLDGTRDRDQLVGEVQRALDDGRMSTPTRPDPAQITAIVDESLLRFASSALLLA
jgi:methyltransferase-like protein